MSIDVTRQKQLEQERLKMIEQLNNYIQCERTINQCLARISVENDFNKAIDEMLRVIGQNAGADRCYIFKYTDQEKVHSDNISEWIRDGVEPKLEKLRSIDLSPVPGWTRKLLRKQDLIIEDADHPPQELAGEAEVLKEHKIQSVLASGIWLENNLWGYIGMEFIHSRRTFSDSDIHTVHSSTKLFLLARERYQQMNAIADSVSLQRQIVDNIAIPIAIFDKDSNIIAANPSLCKVCKIPLAEIVGKKCYDTICNHGNPPEWCPMQQTLSDKYPHSEEAEIHGRRFILTTQPIFDRRHELKYILKSAIDITELTQQKKQLQDAMEAAQAADRAKSYFIATMSHELKTPLNAVIGFSELLQMDNIPREEEKKDLQAINLAGHTLLNLINDVLDLSNMETDKLEINPEPMNLKELLSEMPTIFRQTSESKKAPMELLLPERLPRLVLDRNACARF
ncbi:MAG: histidine kinase dimerization/phospho-acceptor domain-containing protein [Victivallales bacterium]